MLRVITILMLFSFNVNAGAICDPEVSKPCGQVCISKYKNCHKPTTTAKMGKAGRSTKKVYETPKHVSDEEYKKSQGKE